MEYQRQRFGKKAKLPELKVVTDEILVKPNVVPLTFEGGVAVEKKP